MTDMMSALSVMAMGMVGIFLVMGVISLVITALSKVFR